MIPDDDGLELLPYTGGDCLTYEGEINKLAANVAMARYRRCAEAVTNTRIFEVGLMPIPSSHQRVKGEA